MRVWLEVGRWVWPTLSVEALSLMAVPVFLKAVEVFSPITFTFSFSLREMRELATDTEMGRAHLMRVPAVEMAPVAPLEPSDSVVTVF